MTVPRRWIIELAGLAAWLSFALVVGLWFGRPTESMLIGVGLYLIVMLRQLYRFDRLLNGERSESDVKAYGVWKQIFATLIRDITRQESLERTRRDFVANASHELRSPLTVIRGYLDALAEAEELPESWETPISETQRQAERMTTILADLIELLRLESAEGEGEKGLVDVGEMLTLIQKELAVRPDLPRLTLRLETELSLLGSESELHSIFYNLISNAVRFTPSGGAVEVSWRTDDDGAVFAVTDTGIGIPQEHLPRITERFYRVDRARSRATGGTGLGLAIVKHALQRHNGLLAIESRIGEGSTFRCHFPESRVAPSDGPSRVIV